MSEYYDAPSRFEDDPDRSLRIAAGIALCRSVLAGKAKQVSVDASGDDELTDANRRARARATEERQLTRRRADPSPIGDVLPRIKRQGDTRA